MTYQSMTNAHDGMPLLRNESKGTVEVVDESGDGIDELNGSSMSRRSRKGAALGLIVLALGAVSALSALGGKPSSGESSVGMLSLCLVRNVCYPRSPNFILLLLYSSTQEASAFLHHALILGVPRQFRPLLLR